MADIQVTKQAPATVIITTASPQTAVTRYPASTIELTGSPTPGANYFVGDYTPEEVASSGPKFLIQTGLGPNGDDFTIWIDDEAWD